MNFLDLNFHELYPRIRTNLAERAQFEIEAFLKVTLRCQRCQWWCGPYEAGQFEIVQLSEMICQLPSYRQFQSSRTMWFGMPHFARMAANRACFCKRIVFVNKTMNFDQLNHMVIPIFQRYIIEFNDTLAGPTKWWVSATICILLWIQSTVAINTLNGYQFL